MFLMNRAGSDVARAALRSFHDAARSPLARSNIHLITVAGDARCRLFLDAADRDLFLDLLDDVVAAL